MLQHCSMSLATSSSFTSAPPPHAAVVVETAYEWFQRSQRARIARSVAPPTNPTAAAWAFCRPSTATTSSSSASFGTGIAFVDAALQRRVFHPQHQQQQQLPVVDIRGSTDTGKTWTIISLAARFVVATRKSQFLVATGHPPQREDDGWIPPQVIVFDSQCNVTLPKLVYAVRSLLLRRLSGSGAGPSTQEETAEQLHEKTVHFERDMEDCLSRIQVAQNSSQGGDLTGWVPILETVRHQLAPTAADHPTLLLWDGFLSEPDAVSHEGARMEVIRQLERVLLDCSVLLITTTTTNTSVVSGAPDHGGRHRKEWERFITQRIRLDCTAAHSNHNSHYEYLATVHGTQIPFSISMAGILS